ncbi:MAG: phosphoglucomutase/phosphomannomutase family protein [Candidatus Omnitrophica bacterium]|nr:phosphoglucomutase/phosphomannomutase family protein [Candidatus Omnitrophota bacterium]
MTMPIRFGTEGWRGVMGEEFTFHNVRLVTQAIAEHFLSPARRRTRPPTVAVGFDTRFLSDQFARAVCEVLAGNRIRTILSDRAVPTCAVSRCVVAHRLSAGIVITASHNPPIYNGIKVKEAYGGSATVETVASIERRIGRSRVRRAPFQEARADGVIRQADFLPAFVQGIRSFVDLPAIRRSSIHVIADAMHGAADRLIETLLAGGRCRIETIRAEPDPRFGGQAPEPIASHLMPLSRAVRRHRADLGIANDGDADRLGIIGPDGRWLNPGQVMCLLLTHVVKTRGAAGTVVKTVSNTMMINRIAEALGLRLLEVPVGFKHIAKLMREDTVLIGGEESGGIGVRGYLPERDGIVNGLLVLEAMAHAGKTLAALLRELERRYGRWFYDRRDLHLTMPQVERLFQRLRTSPPDRIAGMPVDAINRLDGVKLIGRDESWLLFRRSGTEPIVRVYAESPVRQRLSRLLDLGVRLTKTA